MASMVKKTSTYTIIDNTGIRTNIIISVHSECRVGKSGFKDIEIKREGDSEISLSREEALKLKEILEKEF